jgi:hypothetical protein
MAFTQDQVTALEAAIATGTLRVSYADREVQYQSLSAMRALLRQMRNELSPQPAGGKRRRGLVRLTQTGTGL